MKLLLDTRLLLWAAGRPELLSPQACAAISDMRNELLFSAASLWEVAIKSRLGRSDFRVDPRLLRRGLIENGYVELAIAGPHAVTVQDLPPIHKDPFDRISDRSSDRRGRPPVDRRCAGRAIPWADQQGMIGPLQKTQAAGFGRCALAHCAAKAADAIALERFPLEWNHSSDKKSLQIRTWSMFFSQKHFNFCGTCSSPAASRQSSGSFC